MKFTIRRTPEVRLLGQNKGEASNPMNLIGCVILCWGIVFNSLTKDFEPLNSNNSISRFGILSKNPEVYKNETLRLSTNRKLKVTLKRHKDFPLDEFISSMKKGDRIWYRALLPNGVFKNPFQGRLEIVALGTDEKTFIQRDDYNARLNEIIAAENHLRLVMFIVPFIFFLISYGYINWNTKEYGFKFYPYAGKEDT